MDRPLYNELVPYYELVEGRDWQREIRLIASFLRSHHSETVVDLGCGTGYHLRALTKLGFKATGVDISKENILFARRMAKKKKVLPRFIVGSYYEFQPAQVFDAALCLNWSIPVRNDQVKRFLDNTHSLLRSGGHLIFDYEKISGIAWNDVGKPLTESWNSGRELVVRVSVGRIASNVLYSEDVYIIYLKLSKPGQPSERSRYEAADSGHVRIFHDTSCVRFFSVSEIREFAKRSGFKMVANFQLPRNKYRRNYAVLMKIA
jgi:SAM-dependent methyltransferase